MLLHTMKLATSTKRGGGEHIGPMMEYENDEELGCGEGWVGGLGRSAGEEGKSTAATHSIIHTMIPDFERAQKRKRRTQTAGLREECVKGLLDFVALVLLGLGHLREA